MDVPGGMDALPKDIEHRIIRHNVAVERRQERADKHRRMINFSDLQRADALDLLQNHGIDASGSPEAARPSHDRRSLYRQFREALDA